MDTLQPDQTGPGASGSAQISGDVVVFRLGLDLCYPGRLWDQTTGWR